MRPREKCHGPYPVALPTLHQHSTLAQLEQPQGTERLQQRELGSPIGIG